MTQPLTPKTPDLGLGVWVFFCFVFTTKPNVLVGRGFKYSSPFRMPRVGSYCLRMPKQESGDPSRIPSFL